VIALRPVEERSFRANLKLCKVVATLNVTRVINSKICVGAPVTRAVCKKVLATFNGRGTIARKIEAHIFGVSYESDAAGVWPATE
jgi:hypothetical protein